MVLRHDWVTLYANGIRYLEKAPLMYWSVATSYTYLWSQRMEHAFAPDAGRAGNDPCDVRVGPLGLRRLRRRIRFRVGTGHSARAVLFTRFLIPDVPVGLWLTT